MFFLELFYTKIQLFGNKERWIYYKQLKVFIENYDLVRKKREIKLIYMHTKFFVRLFNSIVYQEGNFSIHS